MEVFGEVAVIAGMLLGLAIIPFGLPGTVVILACALIYAIATHFSAGIGVVFFIVLCVLTLVSETADNWLTAIGARRYGAAGGSMWLSLFGGLAGGLLLGAPFAFILGPLGPVAGGFAGAFLAVFLYEYYGLKKPPREALRAGWGSFLGRMAGIMLKLLIAIGMIIAVAISLFGR